ncbi:MAG TPA: RNA polymerase sigma factor RpoE [Aeromonadales bacterium]|nr:RNA polymerase sigma factor RpoE [Aeromonadales bacterium]
MSAASVDNELVARVQRGDKAAFDVLVKKYQHKIFGLISRYIKDHAEVMDVAQDAFVKAYRALPNFRGDSAFYTWLYRIAINTAKNYLAAQGRRPPGSDIDSAEAENYSVGDALREHDSPEKLLMRDQMRKLVHDTMEELPDELKTALSLREFENMSYEEIAHIMDCPVGTVRSRIFRARAAIDEALEPLLKEQ